ncbi:MAG: UDP-3-O-(3-hydroxymyristoyl)glucosamine N-acyltransferase [Magnetococcales bacterium]|nr:UDP-3-O-(3-hydroxymyristoyl)glucosamine N-acyltransferase [Magnetococcales bacterium]
MLLSALAEKLNCRYHGADVAISGVASLGDAGSGDISFVAEKRYLDEPTNAAALIAPVKLADQITLPCLVSDTPAVTTGKAALLLGARALAVSGIHPRACVDSSAQLGVDVAVGALAVIGADVVIGDNTVIHAGAVIHDRCRIGSNCVIHSNAVIGGEGFGYEYDGQGHQAIIHVGTVRIDDDVHIGSGTTVDRARFGATVIGQGTRIDNLVQIAHNVQVGRHVLIVAKAGIAGSVVIEEGAVIGGQVGIAPHLTIGAGAQIASTTGLANDVPAGETWSGWWGKKHRQNMLELVALGKLPGFMRTVTRFMQQHEGK